MSSDEAKKPHIRITPCLKAPMAPSIALEAYKDPVAYTPGVLLQIGRMTDRPRRIFLMMSYTDDPSAKSVAGYFSPAQLHVLISTLEQWLRIACETCEGL